MIPLARLPDEAEPMPESMSDPSPSRSRLTGEAGELRRRAVAREGLEPLPDPALLRAAIAEARGPDPAAPPAPPGAGPDEVLPVSDPVAAAWAGLRAFSPDPRHLDRHLVVTARRSDPAHAAFDVLRTKAVEALRERGWRRVGVTSPTKGCGKSFTALNLAVTLSRYDDRRTLLLDLDLRLPSLARRLGVAKPGAIGDMLRGLVAPETHLMRVGENALRIGPHLALGLNDRREAFAAELFHEPRTGEALARIDAAFAPDIVLIDLPPALAQDDVIALKAHLDCVLMVAAGGQTTPRDLREAVRRLGEDLPVLGVVLNKAEGEGVDDYYYY
jgi:tyrosine-protein kinase Etk/Wzc